MWDQIRANRQRSIFVVTALGVLLAALGVTLGGFLGGGDTGGALVGGAIALGVWLVLWITSVTRGDDVMLQIAGARQISKKDHPQLVNIVEEMTIASALGTPPRIFIVDDPAPNAFAVGRKPESAAVAVTTGLLSILDRNELQGVVAHELGHVKNRDVALMTTAGIMLGAIVIIAEIGGRTLLYGGGRRSRSSGKDGGGAALAIIAIVMIILAPILAQLLYFALSRRREYLADASGAMFTRYPEGLASALEKLGGSRQVQQDQSRVTAPMYIVRPLAEGAKRSLSSAFSTHPPLGDRIKVLRSMDGGAGFSNYEQAYRKAHGGKGVIGARSLVGEGKVAAVAPETDTTSTRERTREASDAFLAASGYERRTCSACGASHKIPPELAPRVKTCMRCKAPLPAA